VDIVHKQCAETLLVNIVQSVLFTLVSTRLNIKLQNKHERTEIKLRYKIFGVLKAVKMSSVLFWVLKPCFLVPK
jgi:hypothetical protein